MMPVKRFSRYIRVGKYLWKRGFKWMITSTGYLDAFSILRIYSAGFPDGEVIGHCTVTYYLKFKGMEL